MAQIAAQFGSAGWIVAVSLFLLGLLPQLIAAVLRVRELKQKDVDLSLKILKELRVSETTRAVVAESIERAAFQRATGVSLDPLERELLAPLVQNRAAKPEISWADIKRCLPHIERTDRTVAVVLSPRATALYWVAIVVAVATGFISALSLSLGFVASITDEPTESFWLAYAATYFVVTCIWKEIWVRPYCSAVNVRKRLTAADGQPKADSSRLEPSASILPSSALSAEPRLDVID